MGQVVRLNFCLLQDCTEQNITDRSGANHTNNNHCRGIPGCQKTQDRYQKLTLVVLLIFVRAAVCYLFFFSLVIIIFGISATQIS